MGGRGSSQLRLIWNEGGEKLPEAVEEEVHALLAQLLRAVAEAERASEEAGDE